MEQLEVVFMNPLLEAALAPTAVFLIYIYIRDKYEKEPIRLLLLGVLYGALSTAYILGIGGMAEKYITFDFQSWEILYTAFITSAGIEEAIKYVFLYFLVWRNKNFNERFDGIVYAVFIALGFAGIENIIYVFHPSLGGYATALSRAIFSVPGHGLFGVAMGYYFALAKFELHHKTIHLWQAFFVPWLLHGIYNTILLLKFHYFMLIFVPFVGYLWYTGLRKIKYHIEMSPFK